MIILNLFIAVILQGYEDSSKAENQTINDHHLDVFNADWAVLDPHGRKAIELRQLMAFLLEFNRKVDLFLIQGRSILQFLWDLDLPIYRETRTMQYQVYYYDVLISLSRIKMSNIHGNQKYISQPYQPSTSSTFLLF